jgi:phosphate transport system substrate-binding protein
MTRTSPRWRWLVAVMLVLGVFAAACGSDSDSSSDDTSGGGGSSSELPAAEITGSGSTFQAAYNNEVIQAFKSVQPKVTVIYPPTNSGGSGKGQTDLQAELVEFAGSDNVPSEEDLPLFQGGDLLYFPTVAGPITVSYNVAGVDDLKLDGDTIAKIFQGQITKWNDPAIAGLNSGADLPDADIVAVHRSESSGTTANFTQFLTVAAPDTWTLGTDKTIAWTGGQAAEGNGGVTNAVKSTPNSIGYIDYSDAVAGGLSFASIKNKDGEFVKASTESASAAVAQATINPDLSYDPIYAPGADSYAITSPTYILIYKNQTDAAKGNAMKAFLEFIYGDGQEIATTIDYAPLSGELLKEAKAQVDDIVIP